MREANEIKLAEIAYGLSGNFVKKVSCEVLQNSTPDNKVVLFGDKSFLTEDRVGIDIAEASIYNKYIHIDEGLQRVQFFYTPDLDCRTKYNL